MRHLVLALVCLLLGNAPADVSLGRFQQWSAYGNAPLSFTSGGVTVRVEALPCPVHPVGDTSCRWSGNNNQGRVMVRAPGLASATLVTDSQAEYARIAVVRFAARDLRPGVIVESQHGGSAGEMTAQVLIPAARTWRAETISAGPGINLEGEIADDPRDLSGDGRIDLELEDGRFAYAFGCGACTPRPPLFFAMGDGHVVDETRDAALRRAFAADLPELRGRCGSGTDRNGACAAYVAEAARAGRFAEAWAFALRHHDRNGDWWRHCETTGWREEPHDATPCYHSFPASLRAFLLHTGYLPA